MNQNIDIIQMIINTNLVVKSVIIVLLIFSIISWTIIFIKYFYIRAAHKESIFFISKFWKSKNLSSAFKIAQGFKKSPIARIFITGYLELKKWKEYTEPNKKEDSFIVINSSFKRIDNVKRALRRASNTEITKLNHLISFLATAGSTAPFIGLFGTVWGIMESFHNIGKSGSSSLSVVAPGISEALIVTAMGLLVAIPAVICYNYFAQKIKVLNLELHSFSADFLNIIEADILRKKEN